MRSRWLVLLLVIGVVGGAAWAAHDESVDTPHSEVGGDSAQAQGVVAPEHPPFHDDTSTTWYCPAGTVGPPADHRVTVTNRSGQAIEGTLTLHANDGVSREPEGHRVAVPAGGERTVSVAELNDPVVRTAGAVPPSQPAQPRFVAVVAEFDVPVTVSHEVHEADGTLTAEGPCAERAASAWHFPWGVTSRDATDLLVLFNPFPNDVVLDAQFATAAGVREPVRWQGLTVPSGQVVALDLSDDVSRSEHVAVTVTARNGSLLAERLQAFDGSAEDEGLWLLPGQAAPSEVAQFSGGALRTGQRELVALYNPGDRTAEVEVEVEAQGAAGEGRGPAAFEVRVRPGHVQSLELTDQARLDPSVPYDVVVRASAGEEVVSQHVVIDPATEDDTATATGADAGTAAVDGA